MGQFGHLGGLRRALAILLHAPHVAQDGLRLHQHRRAVVLCRISVRRHQLFHHVGTFWLLLEPFFPLLSQSIS